MHDVRAQVVQWIARNSDAVFDYPEIFSSEPPEGGSDAPAAEEQMQVSEPPSSTWCMVAPTRVSFSLACAAHGQSSVGLLPATCSQQL